MLYIFTHILQNNACVRRIPNEHFYLLRDK